MAGAPLLRDSLCDECAEHYGAVKEYLDDLGIAYEEAPRLVRGLDYYTRTVFEVQVTEGLGSQNAIGGGGRYDRLMQEYGGPATPVLALRSASSGCFLRGAAASRCLCRTRRMYVAAVRVVRERGSLWRRRWRDAGIATVLDHQRAV